jgi:hypothetical protein
MDSIKIYYRPRPWYHVHKLDGSLEIGAIHYKIDPGMDLGWNVQCAMEQAELDGIATVFVYVEGVQSIDDQRFKHIPRGRSIVDIMKESRANLMLGRAVVYKEQLLRARNLRNERVKADYKNRPK